MADSRFAALRIGMVSVLVATAPLWGCSDDPLIGMPVAEPNPILRWNAAALDSVRSERLGAAAAARVYALVNVAMYDAVNGMDRAQSQSVYAVALVPATDAPAVGHRRAAAAAAAHGVLSRLFPGQAALYRDRLDNELRRLRNPDHASQAWGDTVAAAVVTARANDGARASDAKAGGMTPGAFRKDFNSAQYRNLQPFAINSKAPYLSGGPPAFNTPQWIDAFNEVKRLGDGARQDVTKEQIVRFWQGKGGSARPPGEWIKIAQVVVPERNLALLAQARLFALLSISLADAVAPTWDNKYTHFFWRPATAIQNATDDNNPETVADPSWTPRNGSTGSSPEYTSGQSAFAGAGSTVLADLLCDDAISFTFTGDNAEPAAGPRTFSGFSAAAAEAGRARIYAGIHFEFSNQAGQKLGRDVAREVLDNALLPEDGSSRRTCP